MFTADVAAPAQPRSALSAGFALNALPRPRYRGFDDLGDLEGGHWSGIWQHAEGIWNATSSQFPESGQDDGDHRAIRSIHDHEKLVRFVACGARDQRVVDAISEDALDFIDDRRAVDLRRRYQCRSARDLRALLVRYGAGAVQDDHGMSPFLRRARRTVPTSASIIHNRHKK